MMRESYLFTSESVSEGHPDKISDQISDAILDSIIAQDPKARAGIEVLCSTGLVLLAGEISTKAEIDYAQIARNTIKKIGYTDSDYGLHFDTCSVLIAFDKQSSDIARGIDNADELEQGAGDQGMMFGYACDETDVLMPAPIFYAHQLVKQQSILRKNGALKWLRPDAKSQVTFKYLNGKPAAVETVVLSTQHDPGVKREIITEAVIEEIIKPVFPENLIDNSTRFLVNPTGSFVIGGPKADCGVTGRKIIVDTYGGVCRHGGGAISGKDPSKVDRSAAYAGRYVAKNLVKAGLAKRCEVQLSYAIGIAEPINITINTFGTGLIPDTEIEEIVIKNFDLRPRSIIDLLQLERPIYEPTAAYGQFGREEPGFPWEKTDKAELLRG